MKDEAELFDYFGDPAATSDIARSDSVITDLFVETRGIRAFLERTPEYHVIVGPKGTGKSLLLFKKAVLATKKSGILVAPSPPQKAYTPTLGFADTEKWLVFWPLADQAGRPKYEQWGRLWEWALLVTVLQSWRTYARRERLQKAVLEELDALLPPGLAENPFDLIASHLGQLESGRGQSKGRFILPDAKPLQDFMLEHVTRFPPPYIFLDNQDDFYFEYPEFWKASGYGCFMAIQELHRVSNHRIHIFLTLRPEIMWELEKSQHYPQWHSDVFYLHWRDNELLELLSSRAQRLRRDLLATPNLVNQDPFGAFVGEELHDSSRGDYMIRIPLVENDAQEVLSLKEHLLRHTLRRPREMIIIGNAILDMRRRREGETTNGQQIIRDAVDDVASRVIANGYIAEVKHSWPWGDPPDESIREFIVQRIEKNVLTSAEVKRIEAEFAQDLCLPARRVDPFVRLASFGLIGWPVPDPNTNELIQKFVAPGEENLFTMPGKVEWYLVHPILYSAPFYVEVVRGLVVGPGLVFRLPGQMRHQTQ